MEPEIMDEPARVEAYARADFSEVNQRFVDEFLGRWRDPRRVLDLGCGPADIPVRLARCAARAQVTAVDASPAMLALGRLAVRGAGFGARITLLEARVPGLPLEQGSFDAAISNSLAHHLPDPGALWTEIVRLVAPGGYVHVMDLVRPESPERARAIVESVAADEHPLLKDDFYNSLLAAFTLGEVSDQLAKAGLSRLKAVQSSDRHWLVSGTLV